MYVTATVFHSRVVYGFSNKDYRYCASARRPLDDTFKTITQQGAVNLAQTKIHAIKVILVLSIDYNKVCLRCCYVQVNREAAKAGCIFMKRHCRLLASRSSDLDRASRSSDRISCSCQLILPGYWGTSQLIRDTGTRAS